MSLLLLLKRRCLFDTQEDVLWFHLHLVSPTNRRALQVLFGFKIRDANNFRLRIIFNNGKKTKFNYNNGIEKKSSLKNTEGTGSGRAKEFTPKNQPGKANLHEWGKGARYGASRTESSKTFFPAEMDEQKNP